MATTPVEFYAPSGLTLTLELFPHGSDTIANGASGDSATERTNAKGVYSADVTQALGGRHDAVILDASSNVIGNGGVYLTDTTTIRRIDSVPDAVWDEVLTGATHNVPSSAGRRLRQIEDLTLLSEGTAQAGTSNTIKLEAGEESNDDWYNHAMIVLTSGTGAGQSRHIHDYTGSSITATVYPVWVTNPVSGTTYSIYSWAQVHVHEMSEFGRNEVADSVLTRDVSNVEAAAGDHSLCFVVLAMSESNTLANAGKLTVFRTDGSTEFAQKPITVDATASAITGIS